MSASTPPSILETWDELTRSAPLPKIRRRPSSPMRAPFGALAGAAVVMAALALLAPRLSGTPGGSSDATASAIAGGTASPSGTPDTGPVRLGLVPISDVTMSSDGMSAHVVFDGGTCDYGYDGDARLDGDALEIGIYALADPEPWPTSDASGIPTVCAGVGIDRSIDLGLDTPFTGTVVRDLYGQVILLESPPWLATIGGLPAGWELHDEGNVLGTATPRWQRTWAPVHETVGEPIPARGDSVLTLIQSHGGPVSTEGGAEVSSVELNGRPATLSVDHYSFGTAMLLVWSIAEDEFALEGWDYDFTREEFIALAESITSPPVELPTDSPIDWAGIIGHSWVAIEVTEHGQPFALVPETRLAVNFIDASRFAANGGCNGIGGTYQIRDGRLAIANVFATLIGCPDARARQDGWYSTFLGSSPTISLDSTGLFLISGDTVITYAHE